MRGSSAPRTDRGPRGRQDSRPSAERNDYGLRGRRSICGRRTVAVGTAEETDHEASNVGGGGRPRRRLRDRWCRLRLAGPIACIRRGCAQRLVQDHHRGEHAIEPSQVHVDSFGHGGVRQLVVDAVDVLGRQLVRGQLHHEQRGRRSLCEQYPDASRVRLGRVDEGPAAAGFDGTSRRCGAARPHGIDRRYWAARSDGGAGASRATR
jgi:hypothetical protein